MAAGSRARRMRALFQRMRRLNAIKEAMESLKAAIIAKAAGAHIKRLKDIPDLHERILEVYGTDNKARAEFLTEGLSSFPRHLNARSGLTLARLRATDSWFQSALTLTYLRSRRPMHSMDAPLPMVTASEGGQVT